MIDPVTILSVLRVGMKAYELAEKQLEVLSQGRDPTEEELVYLDNKSNELRTEWNHLAPGGVSDMDDATAAAAGLTYDLNSSSSLFPTPNSQEDLGDQTDDGDNGEDNAEDGDEA